MTDSSVSIFSLLQPNGGLFRSVDQTRTQGPEPLMFTRIARMGNIKAARAHANRPYDPGSQMSAAGTALEDDQALFLALAEGVERYCTCISKSEAMTWASADELGPQALDLDSVPRCSDLELAHPKCPLIAPDKSKPIRWVRGLSLTDGSPKFIPAIMVYLNTGYAVPAERFWLPITTGCAAHVSYEQATLNAICEVIERDAISLVWLQKLPLPEIEVDCLPPELEPLWMRYQQGSRDLSYRFYDATLDTGVPTVYGVQVAPEDKRLTTLLSCSTALSAVDAVGKVIRDMASIRIAFRNPGAIPGNWDDFCHVAHGGLYMAQAEQLPAFQFLLESNSKRSLSSIPSFSPADEKDALRGVLARLRRCNLDAYAVDLSTDEAVRCGIKVVRVIIPALQPLSFFYRARYLGHPRLFCGPKSMGYPVHPEEHLNHWPQAFA